LHAQEDEDPADGFNGELLKIAQLEFTVCSPDCFRIETLLLNRPS